MPKNIEHGDTRDDRDVLLAIDQILDRTIELIQSQNPTVNLNIDRPALRWLAVDFYDARRRSAAKGGSDVAH